MQQPFELTANAQIWPHSLNSAIGGDNESTYLITSASGNPSGSGLDFVIGSTVLCVKKSTVLCCPNDHLVFLTDLGNVSTAYSIPQMHVWVSPIPGRPLLLPISDRLGLWTIYSMYSQRQSRYN